MGDVDEIIGEFVIGGVVTVMLMQEDMPVASSLSTRNMLSHFSLRQIGRIFGT